MKIQVIGAGSVGLLVASFMQQLGHEVVVVTRNEKQLQQLSDTTLTRKNIDGSTYEANVQATTILIQDAQLTIVTTKSYHLEMLYGQLATLPKTAALLFMQNGLAHYEPALRLPQSDLAFASVQFGAIREDYSTVRHTGIGVFKLAVAKGDGQVFTEMFLRSCEVLPVMYEKDAFSMLFEKALLNCFVNPMTAILQVKNGVLIQNKRAYSLLVQLYEELKKAFPEEMQQFSFELVETLCQKTALNTSSMLMDRIQQQKSEVDAIVLPIIEMASNRGIELPTLQTLYYLMTAIETERDERR